MSFFAHRWIRPGAGRLQDLAVWTVALAVLMPLRPLLAATFNEGQAVEVREGDTWSGATILKQEGRRYQVHYNGGDASTDEWVTGDRLRAPGDAAAAGAAPAPGLTNVPAKPERPKDTPWVAGQKVEAKYGGTWEKAVVVKKQGAWTMLRWDSWKSNEWVEPYRIRKLGSKEDNLGFVEWNPRVEASEGPPSPEPGASAKGKGDTAKEGGDAFSIPNEGVAGLPVTEVDRKSVKTVVLGAPTETQPAPDSNAAGAIAAKTPARAIPLRDKTTGQEAQLILNAPGTFAALAYVPRGSSDAAISFERCDLSAGQSAGVAVLAPRLRVLAISPDGSRLLTRSEKFFGGTRWRADLWSLDTGATPKPLVSFRPYEGSDTDASIAWAQFLDNERVLTCSGKAEVTLWQLGTGGKQPRAVYTISGERRLAPALSAGGRYFMVGAEEMIYVCDAATGAAVARVSAKGAPGGAMSLRADVKRLAMYGWRRLVVWDLTSGQVVNDVGLPAPARGGAVQWAGDGQLLLDGAWLFDLKRQAMAWHFVPGPGGDADASAVSAGRLWYRTAGADSKQLVLASAPVVDASVKAAVDALRDGDALVRPGSKVSLEINLSAPEEMRQKIVAHLTRELTDNGVVVADGQPVKLLASAAAGDSQEMVYRQIGRGPMSEGQKINVTQTKYKLAFAADGKDVWELNSVSGYAPIFLHMKPGQTVEQAASEQTQATFGWFLSISLPKVVLKPSEPSAAGSSTLTSTGARVNKK